AVRRVSSTTEWRPATLDPEDRMYRGYDGIVNGVRFINDDTDNDPLTGDALYDEDFLDGRDNDGDGRIDEDFAAIGQQMFTCVIRDDTQAAIAAAAAERHVPLGVECHQTAWAYSIPGFTDFNVVNWKFFNRSGHELDSVVIGFRVDMDCGPADKSNFFSDDFDAPQYPFGRFVVLTKETDLRLQPKADRLEVPEGSLADSALCPRFVVTVQGFSVVDDDGDELKTPGAPHFLLLDHTIDPTGVTGPKTVGFRAFRSFPGGQPYVQGGNPTIDQQRFELMSSVENIANDPGTPAQNGFINALQGDQKGDYAEWASIGPWLHWGAGATLECTVAIGVRTGDLRTATTYAADYIARAALYKTNSDGSEVWAVTSGQDLIAKYPALDNALAAQIAFEGAYESKPGWPTLPDFHGREAAVKAPTGQIITVQGCEDHDPSPRFVNDRTYQYFDFDCDYCTGAYSRSKGGLFHRTWLAESPPPSPNTNLTTTYNYTDNPDRRFAPGGDGTITLAWDNLSELSSDPKTGWMDFKGYKIWKVSNWTRPVGSGGPAEDDWTLLAEYRQFTGGPSNRQRIVVAPGDTITQCPNIYIPQVGDSVRICLDRGDLFDLQSGDVIKADPSVLCIGYPVCQADSGFAVGTSAPAPKVGVIKYPVGRYRYVDRNVKNGFIYFYSVTAFDSTGFGTGKTELNGRRSAVEAEGIVPQVAANLDREVWVVPNPYRGLRAIADRPSAWDLTPNASDPTGTHIDFMGLPSGKWNIKIFTLSGDWVASISSDDPVNASTRNSTIIDSQGNAHQNVNRQQDTQNDGQARWNLISRNGQDVVSGIYLFTVESNKGTQRGKFVVIR
ncbi:MAG: hypothetical protein K8R56_03045, partial [Candidatus Eisenbacteria bacterium]|nr:hypothetical protein [Candidatus Eisenbacteria bacterium]